MYQGVNGTQDIPLSTINVNVKLEKSKKVIVCPIDRMMFVSGLKKIIFEKEGIPEA